MLDNKNELIASITEIELEFNILTTKIKDLSYLDLRVEDGADEYQTNLITPLHDLKRCLDLLYGRLDQLLAFYRKEREGMLR